MHNNSRKINRKYACIFEIFVVSPSLFRHAYLKNFYQYLAVQKKKFTKSGKYAHFLYFCLTNLDSSLTKKCQVLRRIWIIVSFLRVNCIAQSELGHSWCHLENAHLCHFNDSLELFLELKQTDLSEIFFFSKAMFLLLLDERHKFFLSCFALQII